MVLFCVTVWCFLMLQILPARYNKLCVPDVTKCYFKHKFKQNWRFFMLYGMCGARFPPGAGADPEGSGRTRLKISGACQPLPEIQFKWILMRSRSAAAAHVLIIYHYGIYEAPALPCALRSWSALAPSIFPEGSRQRQRAQLSAPVCRSPGNAWQIIGKLESPCRRESSGAGQPFRGSN